jgi:hypothetical protein
VIRAGPRELIDIINDIVTKEPHIGPIIVFLTPKRGISARDMNKRERKFYDEKG